MMRRKSTLLFFCLFLLASVLNAHRAHAISITQSNAILDWNAISTSPQYLLLNETTSASAHAQDILGMHDDFDDGPGDVRALATVTTATAEANGLFDAHKTQGVHAAASSDTAQWSTTLTSTTHSLMIFILMSDTFTFNLPYSMDLAASTTEAGETAQAAVSLSLAIGATLGGSEIGLFNESVSVYADNMQPIASDDYSGCISMDYTLPAGMMLFLSAVIGQESAAFSPTTSPPAPVPEPTTILLLGSGFVLLNGFRKRITK